MYIPLPLGRENRFTPGEAAAAAGGPLVLLADAKLGIVALGGRLPPPEKNKIYCFIFIYFLKNV